MVFTLILFRIRFIALSIVYKFIRPRYHHLKSFIQELVLETATTTEALDHSCGYIACLHPPLYVTDKQLGEFSCSMRGCGNNGTVPLRAPVSLLWNKQSANQSDDSRPRR